MSKPEPTEEQKQAAREFYDGPDADRMTEALARLLAEREHDLSTGLLMMWHADRTRLCGYLDDAVIARNEAQAELAHVREQLAAQLAIIEQELAAAADGGES